MIKLNDADILNSDTNIFGSWTNSELKLSSDPFRHVTIYNFLNDASYEEIQKNIPYEPSDDFYCYDNPLEVKYAFDKLSEMGEPLKNMFNALSHPKIVEYFSKLFGIENLQYDPHLHGGGIHMHPRHGRLNMHLDYEKHPLLDNMQRRLNIIFYVNTNWNKSWNGATELWDKDMKECKINSYPEKNKAIVFETNEISWHGLPKIINCPEGTYRKTIAYYYISPLNIAASNNKVGSNSDGYRTKATFVKRPNDPCDGRMEKLYNIRPHRRITKEDMEEIFPEWRRDILYI